MDTPLQITFRNIEASEAIEHRIREKVAALEHVHDRITSCRVVVESPHRRHHKGNAFHIQIELGVPGGDEIVVSHPHHDKHALEDLNVALRDAFDAARRRLQQHAAKLREGAQSPR